MPKILVVDAPNFPAIVNDFFLEVEDCHIETVQGLDAASELLDNTVVDVVITDILTSDVTVPSLLDHLTNRYPSIPCVIYTKQASYRQSVDVIKRGAFDYLTEADNPDTIKAAIEKALDAKKNYGQRRRKEDQLPGCHFADLVGESPEMKKVFKTIGKVSDTESTILITGESGTGKELIARAIHFYSGRKEHPMVTINCGAIPRELLESELFGHEKGAFTGAHRTRIGRFEVADGGTIFLDEIGDMSPDLQVKLLRILQEKRFERVGSTTSMDVDIRIVAATNKDLANSIDEGTFREDLFYRLNVIPIWAPPLRNRKSDIPLLINFFLNRMGGRRRNDLKRMKTFSDEAMKAMVDYEWPGNVRELENMIERLSVLVEGDVIQIEDLPSQIGGKDALCSPEPSFSVDLSVGFNVAVDQYQRALILEALDETNWVKAKAADRLKMNRTTLVEKIKKLKIKTPDRN
jgi:two-component system, NtrC family, response regulator PilR